MVCFAILFAADRLELAVLSKFQLDVLREFVISTMNNMFMTVCHAMGIMLV